MRYLVIAIALAVGTTFALGPANSAEPIKSDGKCWAGDPKTNGTYKWGACAKEKHAKTAKAEHKSETKKKA